ncbi:MAG: hypothetical protein MUC97_06875 [Bernardetiaceae bacterium]|nr:hypothetical protein [Bernardetiaceae bacterium]
MTLSDFTQSLAQPQPPAQANELLRALWYLGRGDWEAAHDIAQSRETSAYCLLHAHLHRHEGDERNAAYWYHRAGRAFSQAPIEQEWEQLVNEFLRQT